MNKKTRVVFVEPSGSYSNVFAQYMTIPMMGPLYLGTIAEQAGYDVEILNENLLGREIKAEELINTDILCMSCMTATIQKGKEIAKNYKALRKSSNLDSRTIIGGIHASMIPEDVVNDFDQVFVGEAEMKILDVLNGTIKDKIIHGDRIDNLDIVPIPNHKLLKNWQKVNYWPVMTSRGCPYNCNFCSVTQMFGRGYRMRSIDKVIEEASKYKKQWVFFIDDNFVVDKKRTRELLYACQSNGIRKWSCQVRVESSRDLELVRHMAEAGCQTVYIGFESINPESLKEMQKKQTVDDVKSSIQIFKKYGINVHGMFIFGSDSDTQETMPLTSRFCRESGLTSVQYMILTPLPGTIFYKKMETEGRLLHKDWQYYDAMHVVFNPKNFTPSELQQGMIDCFSDFYSYTNAFNDAINLFFKTSLNLIVSLNKKVYFPSWVSPFVKLFGKRIVKSWLKFNQSYLSYLHNLSINHKINLKLSD